MVCQKVPLRLKQGWTVKKIKPIALDIVELYWSEDISQSVSLKEVNAELQDKT